jgi:hypothetical protein
MKKIFALTVIFVLVLVACDLFDSGDNGTDNGTDNGAHNTTLKIKNESSKILFDVLWNNAAFYDTSGGRTEFTGTWTGIYSENTNHPSGTVELEISATTWSTLFRDSDGTLEIVSASLGSKDGNIQYLRDPVDRMYNCGTLSLSGNKLILNITTQQGSAVYGIFPIAKRRETYELTKLGDPFKPGTNVTREVESGSSYIFFKVGSTAYRTQSVIIVEKNENKEFIFNDYTIVVDVTNSTTKPLGGL